MKKQLMTACASLLLAFTLTAVTPAQSGECRLNEDGSTKCGNLPPDPESGGRRINPTSTSNATSTSNMFLVLTMLDWLSIV